MVTIRDFWREGAMRGIESAAARRAIAETWRRWLPILEVCGERDEDGVDEFTLKSGVCVGCSACRRPVHCRDGGTTSPASPRAGATVPRAAGEQHGRPRLDKLIARHGPKIPLPELRDILAGDCPKSHSVSIYDKCSVHFPQLPRLFMRK